MADFDQYSESSDEYDDDDDQSDEYSDDDDGNYFIDCAHCDSQVLERNYNNHLERVHKCSFCPNYMPKASIPEHIERKHMTKCPQCSSIVLDQLLSQHILQEHPNIPNGRSGSIGTIQLDKISNEQFNQLANAKRIYAKDGQLFIK